MPRPVGHDKRKRPAGCRRYGKTRGQDAAGAVERLDDFRGGRGNPGVGAVRQADVEPVAALFEKDEFNPGVERFLKGRQVVVAVALAGEDLRSDNDALGPMVIIVIGKGQGRGESENEQAAEKAAGPQQDAVFFEKKQFDGVGPEKAPKDGQENQTRAERKIVMPEEKSLGDFLRGGRRDIVEALETGEGEILEDVGIVGLIALGPAIVEDGAAEIAGELAGVGQIVIDVKVADVFLLDQIAVAQGGLLIQVAGLTFDGGGVGLREKVGGFVGFGLGSGRGGERRCGKDEEEADGEGEDTYQ